MQEMFTTFKTIHVLAAILLVGNVVVTAVWKSLADRTGKAPVIAFAQRLVTLTDFVFTAPSAVILFLSGFAMMGGPGTGYWKMAWVHTGVLLFAISALVWLVVLIPTQVRQARLARTFAESNSVPGAYFALCRRWRIADLLSALPLIAAAILMVLKPGT